MQAQQEQLLLMIKGKRSKRPRSASPLTSSSTTAESSGGARGSGGCDHHLRDNQEEEDMANCLILLAKGRLTPPPQAVVEVYQCKTCNKSFPSFQALGGHRASHKRPIKPPTLEEKKPLLNSTTLSLQIPSSSLQNKITRVHECSICGAEFSSGQALGGHMRRHRPIATVSGGDTTSSQEGKRQRNLLSLDLNLPAPEDNDHRDGKFAFAPKEQVIVFSASPLVDCHY